MTRNARRSVVRQAALAAWSEAIGRYEAAIATLFTDPTPDGERALEWGAARAEHDAALSWVSRCFDR